jgi:hypothetical protein
MQYQRSRRLLQSVLHLVWRPSGIIHLLLILTERRACRCSPS